MFRIILYKFPENVVFPFFPELVPLVNVYTFVDNWGGLGVGDAWHKSGSLWGHSFKELQSPPESWGSEAHTGLGLTAGEETVTLHCSNYCI